MQRMKAMPDWRYEPFFGDVAGWPENSTRFLFPTRLFVNYSDGSVVPSSKGLTRVGHSEWNRSAVPLAWQLCAILSDILEGGSGPLNGVSK